MLAVTRMNNGSSVPLTSGPQVVYWPFINPGRVAEGDLYHIVFTNTHPTDYISLNGQRNYQHLDEHGGPYFKNDFTILHRWRQRPWVNAKLVHWINYHYTDGEVTGPR